MYDIVILTQERYINPKKNNWYTNQVLIEEDILIKNLKSKGLKVCKKYWFDKEFDWNTTKYAIFRTTWDYFEKIKEFKSWLNETKNKTEFINSYEVINWNLDKKYLNYLANNGVNIASTIFIKKRENITLSKLFKKTNFNKAVIKPCISGAALDTYKIDSSKTKEYEVLFNKLIQKKSFIFQEYLENITKKGEISLIMINGQYTHAVKKIAKKGDFRVQDDHGGIVEKYIAKSNEIKFAKRCLEKCPFKTAYARVDLVYDNNNEISLSELELIEPELWFRNNKDSAKKLSDYIYKKMRL